MNERIFNRILAGSLSTRRAVSNLESFFSPTVSHEVHHQNFKHQQRHPSRNP
jgi:hypothetical protein